MRGRARRRHGRGVGGARRHAAGFAVLGYRIVNYWLPMLPGAMAYLRLRLRPATYGSQEPSTL